MRKETVPSLALEYAPGTMPEIFTLINRMHKKLAEFQKYVIRESDLTPAQYNLLNILTEGEGYPLSQLASMSHCSRSTMTSLVDTLEKKKLVKRESHPNDRRSLLVRLTEKGKARKQSVPSLNRIFGSCCSSLEQKELQRLSSLLKKLEKSLNFGEACNE